VDCTPSNSGFGWQKAYARCDLTATGWEWDMLHADPRQFVKRLVARTGFQIKRTSALETLDLHIIRVFAALGINCVLDVGAHEGHFGKRIRSIGYQGYILSFEPVACNFAELSRTARGDPRWRVFPFGLGDHNRGANINVFAGSTFHSLLAPSEFGRECFGDALTIAGSERIEIKRLDEVLDFCLGGIAQPRVYLKIDTQGHDLAVVDGASTVLDRVLALQTEAALKPIYEDMPNSLCNTIPELQKRGFAVSGLFPVTRDEKDGLQIIEVDCVMTRSRVTSAPAA
jgi:FkbM family methyltransferase